MHDRRLPDPHPLLLKPQFMSAQSGKRAPCQPLRGVRGAPRNRSLKIQLDRGDSSASLGQLRKSWKNQFVPMPLKLAVTEETEILFLQVVGNRCALGVWS